MVNILQALILAALQGVSELFPISSLGHTVIIPALLKWHIQNDSTTYLAFIVMLHLGTTIALFIFFYKDWIAVVRALLKALSVKKISKDYNEHLGVLLIAGTIPVGILGVLFEAKVKNFFATPMIAAFFLIVNGFVLYLGDMMRKKNLKRQLKSLIDFKIYQAFLVGLFQSFALIPGISRSGTSIVGGIVQGLDYEDSAKFSFMLATPAILAASLFEIRNLFHSSSALLIALLGAIIAGIFAYLSTRFLMRYFKTNTLMPFVYYCWIVGLISLYLFKFVY